MRHSGGVDIAVLDDYQAVALEVADWSRLQAQGKVQVFTDHVVDPVTLVERLQPYGAVIMMRERTPLPAAVIERLPNLRLIVTTGRRNPVLDVAAATRRGITVCNTGGLSAPTAELTWALILGCGRHLRTEAGGFAAGGWQTTVGMDLAGATLGILGFGRIGRQVAVVGQAFGMRVLAVSRSLDTEAGRAAGVEAVSIIDLLRRSDVVSIHLPLTDDTRGLIDRDALAQLKPTALLINTARGPIVDTVALREALAAGRLAGAGIDVFDSEPPAPDDPMRTAPGVLATPHLGYVTRNGLGAFYREAVEDVEAFLAGRPIRVVTS